MPDVSLTAPTDYAIQAAEIERRRKLADMLSQQALAPEQTNQTAGGWTVATPWTQHAAKLLSGYLGGKGQEAATQQQMALASAMRGERAATFAKAMEAARGTPERTLGSNDPGDAPVTHPAVPGSLQTAYGILASSNVPDQATAGQAAWLKSMEPVKLREGEVVQSPTGQVLNSNPKTLPLHFGDTGGAIQPMDPRTGAPVGPATAKTVTPDQQRLADQAAGWGDPYDLNGATVQSNAVTGEIRQVVNRPPQTHVYSPPAVTVTQVIDPNDPTRLLNVDARTYKGGTLGSPGVVGVSGKVGDKEKLDMKRAFNMQGIGATIQEAENLLSGAATGNLPTASYMGAGTDLAGRIVGHAPKGSAEAAQLEALGGALVAKMPRMEGPQSDKDVLLYKQMAGKVGDRTVPIAERVAALNMVKNLWTKYERLNPDAFEGGAPSQPAPVPTPQRRATDRKPVRRFNPATGQIE